VSDFPLLDRDALLFFIVGGRAWRSRFIRSSCCADCASVISNNASMGDGLMLNVAEVMDRLG
jgi:hypothetical protein